MNDNDGNENDDTCSLFEPIDVNYTHDDYYGNLQYGGNNNNNNNNNNRREETVSLRFSDMSMDTQQILNDIISEDENRMSLQEQQQGGGGEGEGQNVPSVTLTTVMDDDLDDFLPGDFEPIPVMSGGSRGVGVDGGQQQPRRSSSTVITMRPSLMSPGVATKIMEGMMKIDSTTNTTTTNLVEDHYQPDQQRPHKMSRRTDNNRFSISADPTEFGPGGTPIIQLNATSDTGNGGISTTKVMRYSISRDTLDMFDEPYHDYETCHDSDHSNDPTEEQEEKLQVSDIEKETVLRIPNITAEIHECHEDLLAKEMDKLSFDDKHKIMSDVHGIPTISTALTGSATSQNNNNNNADPLAPKFKQNENEMKIERCLQQLTMELREPNLTTILLADPKFGNGMTKTAAFAEDIAAAYHEAEHINPHYVNQKRLRLTFLLYQMQSQKPISETTTTVDDDDTSNWSYYAQATAGHIAYHFWKKKELFGGGAVLARDVRLSDLSTDDREGTCTDIQYCCCLCIVVMVTIIC